MEKTIVSVLGKDNVGIIANITGYLAKVNVNILDVSQTIKGGFFNMLLIADTNKSTKTFSKIKEELKELGDKMGVQIVVQNEKIFEKMHRI